MLHWAEPPDRVFSKCSIASGWPILFIIPSPCVIVRPYNEAIPSVYAYKCPQRDTLTPIGFVRER